MNDRVEVVAATTVGALLGGLAGYLLLTAGGRRLLENLNATTDQMLGTMQTVGQTLRTLEEIVTEARMAMENSGATGSPGASPGPQPVARSGGGTRD